MSAPATTEVMFGRLGRLRHTYRYSAQPVIYRENVAEHSFWTAMIAMAIVCDLGKPGRMGEVAKRALLHDVEESMTGDLVRDMKYFDKETREAIGKVEQVFADRLFSKMGDVAQYHFRTMWKFSKDETFEGRVVALADLLCVISYCRHEESMGNKSLMSIESDCLQLIGEKFGQLDELFDVARSAIDWSPEDA